MPLHSGNNLHRNPARLFNQLQTDSRSGHFTVNNPARLVKRRSAVGVILRVSEQRNKTKRETTMCHCNVFWRRCYNVRVVERQCALKSGFAWNGQNTHPIQIEVTISTAQTNTWFWALTLGKPNCKFLQMLSMPLELAKLPLCGVVLAEGHCTVENSLRKRWEACGQELNLTGPEWTGLTMRSAWLDCTNRPLVETAT